VLNQLVPIAYELRRVCFKVRGNAGHIARMRRMDDKLCMDLAEAFGSALDQQVSEDEKKYISQIEKLRREMEASSQDVEVVDFGAGSGGNNTPGRIVHISLAKLCRSTSRRPATALLLMKLLRTFKPTTAIELGTSVGISAAYQGVALELNSRGKLITFEGAPAVASIAESNLRRLGLGERVEVVVGCFTDTLHDVLQRGAPIDFAFIDGHHDFAATLAYFEQIKPWLSPSAIVLFDDISWSSGMAAAWKKIVADPCVGIVVDIFSMGLCVLNGPKHQFRIAMPRS